MGEEKEQDRQGQQAVCGGSEVPASELRLASQASGKGLTWGRHLGFVPQGDSVHCPVWSAPSPVTACSSLGWEAAWWHL